MTIGRAGIGRLTVSATPSTTVSGLSLSGVPNIAVIGTPYSLTPTVAGGTGAPTYTLNGALPPGLSFSSTTGITGTPTGSGSYNGVYINAVSGALTASLGPLSLAAYDRTVAYNASVSIGGLIGQSQSASTPYGQGIIGAEPIAIGSNSRIRFEVRGNDAAPFDPPNTRNRSEVAFPGIPFYALATFDFECQIASNGTLSNRPWLIPFQIHGDDTLGVGPVFCFNIFIVGGVEYIGIGSNYGVNASNTVSRNFTTAPYIAPFTRDVWHTFHVEFIPDKNEGVGRIRVVFDGVELLNITNVSTGYSTAVQMSYPKIGIYAGPANQITDKGLVSEVRNANFVISATSFSADSTAGTADSTLTTADQG